MNIKVRSYIGKGGWIKWLINRRSNPAWHTEYEDIITGLSFSATMQDGEKCVRAKNIKYTHKKRWITHIIPVLPHYRLLANRKFCELEGKKYDLLGLLSFGTPFSIIVPHRNRYWCTELVLELLKATGLPKFKDIKPDTFHPQGLVGLLDKLGYEREE